jgi:CRP-like cAMP-binding protein
MNLSSLRALAGWGDLGEGELRGLANYVTERWVRVGTLLQDFGQPLAGLALITQGEVQTMMTARDMALLVELLGPGRWIGTEALADGGNALVTARALTDVRVLILPMEQFERVRNQPTPVGLRLLRSLVASAAATEARQSQLAAQAVALQQKHLRPGRSELAAMGFAKVAFAIQPAAGADRSGVEVVQHDGVAVAANFRPLR